MRRYILAFVVLSIGVESHGGLRPRTDKDDCLRKLSKANSIFADFLSPYQTEDGQNFYYQSVKRSKDKVVVTTERGTVTVQDMGCGMNPEQKGEPLLEAFANASKRYNMFKKQRSREEWDATVRELQSCEKAFPGLKENNEIKAVGVEAARR